MSHTNQPWTIEDAEETYGVSRWGAGFFSIAENGNFHVQPNPHNPQLSFDFKDVIDEILEKGIQLPVVVRFHDILRSQVNYLNKGFRSVIAEANYQGNYNGVYPVKVNQMREVVEEIVDAGEEFDFGLEAGSKAELLTVLAYNTNPNALTILNGYKDDEFIELAMLGRKLGRKIIIVIEKYSELERIISAAKAAKVVPLVGIRAKLSVTGNGKWQGSSGEKAKFGLSISEMLSCAKQLSEAGFTDSLQLVHFHIGSQLPEIRQIKDAVTEAARIFVELYKLGYPVQYLDVGGGLGIDYDGTKSTSESSRNYSIDEYVADIVYGIKEVCDLESVPHPHIVSESGRALTAHHSCVITEIVGEIKVDGSKVDTSSCEGEHFILRNMRELFDTLHTDMNLQEAYNDAYQYKGQALDGFRLGVIDLEQLGKIETLYWQVMRWLATQANEENFSEQTLESLNESLSSQYLCNFSVFQSTADTWAIDQLLPIAPLTRMNERPTINASLVDITCDSDGKIDQFVVERQLQDYLPLHQLKPGEPYYLGIFLTGAYQDVMGDMHNLFGRLTEVHIYGDDDDLAKFYIEEVVPGSSVNNVLSIMQYNPEAMAKDVKRAIDKQISLGHIKPREGVKLTDFYEDCLRGYTYLKT